MTLTAAIKRKFMNTAPCVKRPRVKWRRKNHLRKLKIKFWEYFQQVALRVIFPSQKQPLLSWFFAEILWKLTILKNVSQSGPSVWLTARYARERASIRSRRHRTFSWVECEMVFVCVCVCASATLKVQRCATLKNHPPPPVNCCICASYFPHVFSSFFSFVSSFDRRNFFRL